MIPFKISFDEEICWKKILIFGEIHKYIAENFSFQDIFISLCSKYQLCYYGIK